MPIKRKAGLYPEAVAFKALNTTAMASSTGPATAAATPCPLLCNTVPHHLAVRYKPTTTLSNVLENFFPNIRWKLLQNLKIDAIRQWCCPFGWLGLDGTWGERGKLAYVLLSGGGGGIVRVRMVGCCRGGVWLMVR